jgi:rSAM/selenodomain-associated transferase 1
MTPGLIGSSRIPICIFAKPPLAAEVKTRLIPALGANGAAQLASAMLRDVWRTVESHPGVRPILATTRSGSFPISVPDGDVWLQPEGDLGERIERIITRGLLLAPVAMAVGADSPAFTAAHLDAALRCLGTNDAIIGPSTDGGFYLLALGRCPPGLFAGLPWSSAETRQALKVRLQEHSFSVAELEPLFDVDIPADLARLAEYVAAHPCQQSATRAWWLENSCASASLFQL